MSDTPGEYIGQADRLRRLRELADHVDRYVADRPELVTSQVGFGAGLVIGAIKRDPEAALEQLERFVELGSKALAWVNDAEPPTDSDLLEGLGLTTGDTPA